MGSLRRQVGFWAAVGRQNLKVFVTPEVGGGIVLGVAGSIYMVTQANLNARADLVASYLPLAGALLGIVFASMALVVALFTSDYLRYLDSDGSGEGVIKFLSPFMLAIGLQVAVLLGAVAYGAGASALPGAAEAWVFGTLTVLFVVAALDVVAIARSVVMHGVLRSRISSRDVRHIEDKRSERRSSGP